MSNKKRYLLKERLAKKFDVEYEKLNSSNKELPDKEIDDIVKEVTNINQKFNIKPYDATVIPKGKNSDRSEKLFHRRKYYRDYALPDTTQNLNEVDGASNDDTSNFQGQRNAIVSPFSMIDMMHHKSYYGKIDTNNRSIYPSEKFLKMVNAEDDVFLLNFVADAANEMIEKINRMVQVGKIRETSAYSSFSPSKGWTSMTNTHHNLMKDIFELFIKKHATSKKYFTKITDFNSYLTHLTNFLNIFLPKYPITRSNLQLASRTNPNISGIVFEIETESHDDDEVKYKKFILDPDFENIAHIANGFGFMIDKNAPWRFIADLESPQMQHRMQELEFESLQDMFSAYYYDTHLYEVNSLRDYVLSFYDSYVEAYPYYSKTHLCDQGAKTILHERKKRNKNPFSDEKLLEFYFYVRAKEADKPWNQEYFDSQVREAISVFNTYGFIEALHFVNDRTTQIIGKGANPGMRTVVDQNSRIFSNRQTYNNRNTFTIKL